MADGIQFPDYYAQADQRAMRQQELAQQMMVTQGMQAQQKQQQQTAQRADQFMQQMQQVPEGANWADKIGAAAQSAIKTGDFADADKIIGVWGKAAEQQAKSSEEGAKAVAADLANKSKKFSEQASAISGVTSQADLDYRNQVYAQAHGGEQLPFKQFVPGMDKTFQDMTTSALDRAKIISEQSAAKAAQQNADANTMRSKAGAAKDYAEAAAAKTRSEALAKEGPLDLQLKQSEIDLNKAKAANGGGTGAAGGGAINFRYNNAQTGASNEVATEVENWQKLNPSGTASMWNGMLKPGASATDALRAFAARKVTPTEAQVLGTTFGGMGKSVATMSQQGRPVTTPVLNAITQSVTPMEGDDGATVLAKGARLRQYMENNVRDLEMSKGSPEHLEQARQNLARVEKYLPTWDQVIAAVPSNKRGVIQRQEKATESDIAKEKAAAPAAISSDDEYNALPSGAEFIAPDGSHRKKP